MCITYYTAEMRIDTWLFFSVLRVVTLNLRTENDIRQQNEPVFCGYNYFYSMAFTSLLFESFKSLKIKHYDKS